MKTITVQGHGNASRSPDQIRITLALSEQQLDFSDAIAGCNARIALLKAAAKKVGVQEDSLKTAQFNVTTASEWDQDTRKNIDLGFVANQSVFAVLPWDKKHVGRFLTAVIQSGAMPRISLKFLVSNTEEMRQAVIADAVANAKKRAEVIAASAGVKLGFIQTIDYGYSEIRVSSDASDLAESGVCRSMAAPDIEPDEVKCSDTVTVTWLIKQPLQK